MHRSPEFWQGVTAGNDSGSEEEKAEAGEKLTRHDFYFFGRMKKIEQHF
jgi:hypothetical protein